MGIGAVFTKTFDILKKNPKIIWPYLIFTAVIGVAALYFSLSLVSSYSGSLGSATPGYAAAALDVLAGLVPLILVVMLVSVFVAPFMYGMYMDIADQGYGGGKVLLKKAYDTARANYLNMLLAGIAVGICWVVAVAVLAIVFALPAAAFGLHFTTGLWIALGVLVSIVALILLSIYLFEVYAVVIIEGKSPIDAIRRSFDIGKKNLGSIFGVLAITCVIGVCFAIVDSLVIIALEFLLTAGVGRGFGIAGAQVVNFILSAAFSSWIALLPVGFYKEFISKKGKAK